MRNFLLERKKYFKYGYVVLLALAGTYGFSVLSTYACGTLFTGSVWSVAVFGVLIGLQVVLINDLQSIEGAKRRSKRIAWGLSLAVFFALTLVLGYQLKFFGMTDGGLKGKVLILAKSVALGIGLWPFSNAILFGVEKIALGDASGNVVCKSNKWDKLFQKSGLLFLALWGFVFLCWIPVFLAYYPAVMSYDFHRQSIEAMKGFQWFYAYQPLAHTWLFWVAFQIGKAVNSLQFGMACYTVVQMLVFSAAGAYSCVIIYRLCGKKIVPIFTALFWGLFPFVSVLAVCTTKDVYFTAFFVVFVCIFAEITFLRTEKCLWLEILWVLEGVLMILFRNNAIYAVVVFGVVHFLLGERKKRIRMLVLCLVLALAGKGALEGMFVVLGTQIRGSAVEMFSVPINQFARVGNIHGDVLSDEEYALLDTYIPAHLWRNYNPWISDPIKGNLGNAFSENWKDNWGSVLRAWVKLGVSYPNEYIDAFLLLTSGYWFIDDTSWAEVLGVGREGRMGAIYTYTSNTSEVIPDGIAQDSKLPKLQYFLEGIVSDNEFFEWPVVSVLFKPAFYCWMLLGVFLMAIYTKQKEKWLFCCFPLVYLATMFLGPVVQFRYVLPIMMITPILLAVFGYKKKEI